MDTSIIRFVGRRLAGLRYALRNKALPASFAIALCSAASAAPLDIAQVPLYLGGYVPANIMYIIDDSLSMNYSFIPDSISGDGSTKRAKSSSYNTLYYNPNVTYSPPLDHTGASLANASFTAAKIDGYDSASSTRDLSTSYSPTFTTATPAPGGEAAYYYVFDNTNILCDGTASDDDCYTKVVVSTTSGPGSTDERTNFANWYSYYRTRLMTAKAGSSIAFATLGTAARVGYGALCGPSTGFGCPGTRTIDGESTTTILRGVRPFSGTDRQDFYTWLFATQPKYSTPTRRALDAAGQYFRRTDARGPYSTTPGVTGGENLSCRQNYAVVMTDGYWSNDLEAATADARLNVDGNAGSTITGPGGASYTYSAASPFTDSRSNTLADVAMYYWKNDLTGLTNNVPTTPANPAFWQHMVTIGVGLGVPTQIDPDDAFDAIGSGATITWPDPEITVDGFTNLPAARADDLLHAAVNSRGGFYNAQSPNEFAAAMTQGLNVISSRTSSASAIATNSTRLDTGSYIYQARFNSEDWSGQLLAYKVNTDGSVGTAQWNAASLVPAHGSRQIFTHNGTTGVEFTWNNLASAERSTLGATDAIQQNVVGYLRGNHSLEQRFGGNFRNRTTRLGDIVNSDPWYVGNGNFGYNALPDPEGDAYVVFRSSTAYKNRPPMLYVGANDGMLRGFDATTGVERLAYVPRAIITSNLATLADPNYTHKYFVDGPPRSGDAYINRGGTNKWTTVLLGSTGAGGRSVFALDVTNPGSFSASDVMWEFTHAELGATIGQPSIVRMRNGKWAAIFGNGYNSTSGTARLFVVNLETGALIKAIDTGVGTTTNPNGLATPLVVDVDDDRMADYVYAGDLYGNMWKFDITSTHATNFNALAVAYKLHQALDADGNPQPITAKPTAGRHPESGLMVYFGTGKYFETGDNVIDAVQANRKVHTFYGLWDNGSLIGARGTNLLQQSIVYENTMTFGSQTHGIRVVSDNGIGAFKGWYIDLLSPPPANLGRQGEMVVATPLLWRDRVIFVTIIPDPDPCSFGGISWMMEVDPLDGGRLDYSAFDLNKDGLFDTGDYVEITLPDGTRVRVPVSGRRSEEGLIKTPGTISAEGVVYKYASGSSGNIEVIENKAAGGAGRQSWQQLR